MKNLSLRLRLILSLLCVAICIWITAALLSWIESRKYMDEFFDTYQLLLARQLSTADWQSIQSDSQTKADEIFDDLSEDGEEEDDALGFAVFNQNGDLIFHDDENGADFIYHKKANGFLNQQITHKKKEWRIVFVKSADSQFTIAVGQELKYRFEAAFDLMATSLLPWLAGLIVLIIASFWLVIRELRPLKTITNNLSRRHPHDLSPITLKQVPEEIKPLLNAMNMLFIRIEKMLERERSFISDSAHELRSPLTALKVQLEVAELSENDPISQKKALQKLKEGIDRSSRLIEQLLMLSRLDSQSRKTDQNQLIEWKALIQSVINDFTETFKEKKITVKILLDNPGPIETGELFLWNILLRNLIDNALKYSPINSVIFIKTENKKLVIQNEASFLPTDNITHLGERFFRPAGQHQPGSGLGLSIVKKIAELHQCTIKIVLKGNTFEVWIGKIKRM